MIEITGTSEGKVYKEELVDVKTAAKIAESDIDFDSTDSIVFKLLKEKTKNDPANKMVRHQNRRSFAPIVSGRTKKGEYITFRYYKSKQKTKDGVKYSPTRIFHKGMEMKVDAKKDKELAFFLSICAMCKDSPIVKGKQGKHFFIDDKQKNAKELLRKESMIASLITSVNSMPEGQVKRIAHAIKLTGTTETGKKVTRSVSGVRTEPIEAIRAQLVRIAKELPREFTDIISDQDTLLKGAIREAKAEGVIIAKTLGKGVVAWVWRDNIEEGSEICRTRIGQDQYVAIFQYVTSKPETFEFFNTTVNDAMGYDNLIETVSAEPNTNIAIVEAAIKANVIYFDRSIGKVVILNGEGEVEGHPVHIVKDIKNWQQELANAMGKAPVKKARISAVLKK